MGVNDRAKLTWEAKPRRWRKVYRGKAYTVSCRELGTPETKEGNYRAANDGWAAKLAELQGREEPPAAIPKHITLGVIKKRLRWAEENGHPDIAADYRERLSRVERIAAHAPSTPAEMKHGRRPSTGNTPSRTTWRNASGTPGPSGWRRCDPVAEPAG